MPRDLVVGNGNLLICLDKYLHLRDLYYPRVGELNHIIGHYHRLGIWVDGRFSWLSYEDWRITPGYRPDTLVTQSTAENPMLQLKLTVLDTVLPEKTIYLRQIHVEDTANTKIPREIRLFFCQDFYLYESDIGDTAFYDPHSQAIIHFKRKTYFLCAGLLNGQTPMTDYSCGTKKFHGAEGTWKDAEDGSLSKNPIAQGSVDSAMGFRGTLYPDQAFVVDYWLIAGETLNGVRTLNRYLHTAGCNTLLHQTEQYWRNWTVSQMQLPLETLPEHLGSLFKRSILTIRTQMDNGGAITAANDTDYFSFSRDTYSYMWPRDGAFVAYALDQTGHQELTRRFFLFCHRIFQDSCTLHLETGEEPRGFFYHKYTPSGAVGSSWHPWVSWDGTAQLPIQEDETALVLWALWFHYQKYRDIEFVRTMYETMIVPAANFLCFYRDPDTHLPLPSYDLWEERLGIHTFTVAAVYAGLAAAARFATLFGDTKNTRRYTQTAEQVKQAALTHLWCPQKQRFYRHLIRDARTGQLTADDTAGSSTAAMFIFGLLPADDPRMIANMQAVHQALWVKTPIGGLARYQNDYYHQISSDTEKIPGNPWIVCTMWLAQWRIAIAKTPADLAPALDLLQWVHQVSLPSGLLPEQLNPLTGEPVSVAPLTWSHAAYITTVTQYLETFWALTNPIVQSHQPESEHAQSVHVNPHAPLMA